MSDTFDVNVVLAKGIDSWQIATYSLLAGLSFVLAIPPLILEIKERNMPLASLFFGFTVLNLFNMINAVLWHNSDPSTWWDGTGLCDIETKLYLGINQLVLGAVASVFRQLARILRTDSAGLFPSTWQKRRQIAFEWTLCTVFPIMLMFAHYWVQPFRYLIFTVAGCEPANGSDWRSIVLLQSLSAITCMIGLYYGMLTICRLFLYRRQISSVLANSQSRVSKARFVRLLILSCVLVTISTPLVLFTTMANVVHQIESNDYVTDIRSPNWYKIRHRIAASHILVDRWIRAVSGVSIFFLFGLVENARIMYKTWTVKLGLARSYQGLKARLWPQSTSAIVAGDRSRPSDIHLHNIQTTTSDLLSEVNRTCCELEIQQLPSKTDTPLLPAYIGSDQQDCSSSVAMDCNNQQSQSPEITSPV